MEFIKACITFRTIYHITIAENIKAPQSVVDMYRSSLHPEVFSLLESKYPIECYSSSDIVEGIAWLALLNNYQDKDIAASMGGLLDEFGLKSSEDEP